MNEKRCSRCKADFTSEGLGMVCPECLEQDEKDFAIVRDHVLMNDKLNALKLAQETGVSASKIMKFIREGKLSLNKKRHSE